jgi:hypothetical protein
MLDKGSLAGVAQLRDQPGTPTSTPPLPEGEYKLPPKALTPPTGTSGLKYK